MTTPITAFMSRRRRAARSLATCNSDVEVHSRPLRPRRILRVLALPPLLLLLPPVVLSQTTTTYTAITNARIYTVDPAATAPAGGTGGWAEALVAYDGDGTLTAVGTNDEIRSLIQQSDTGIAAIKEIDLGGRLVLPGFVDAHLHAVEAGINSRLCEIPADAPPLDIPCYLRDCPDGGAFGDQGWIVGAGTDVGILLEALDLDPTLEYPMTELDDAYPDTPVLILDYLGHAALANSVAMEIVGYDLLQGDPPGGMIGRDPITDKLTGIVLENAQQRLRDAAFPPTEANQQVACDGLMEALNELARNGITTVSDAGGFYRQAQTGAWARAESEETLTVRASNALYVYPDVPISDQISEFTSRFGGGDDDADGRRLARFDRAKIYVDGILSLGTAALYEPYLSSMCLPDGDQRGFEYFGRYAQCRLPNPRIRGVSIALPRGGGSRRWTGTRRDRIRSGIAPRVGTAPIDAQLPRRRIRPESVRRTRRGGRLPTGAGKHPGGSTPTFWHRM